MYDLCFLYTVDGEKDNGPRLPSSLPQRGALGVVLFIDNTCVAHAALHMFTVGMFPRPAFLYDCV